MNLTRLVWLDYVAIALYAGVLLAIGRRFARREKTTNDFFLGGRRIPWWAAGLSIYATGLSAISFVAIPAKTYRADWSNLAFAVLPVFGILIAAYCFVPLLRRLNVTTIMEYYELRFSRAVRWYGSLMAVLAQVGGRMSVVLLIPSMALAEVTELNLTTCILLMGVLATVYTVAGGIGAVIWTDVVQFAVIFGGAIYAVILLLSGIDGGAGEVLRVAAEQDKLRCLDWTWSLRLATIWVFLLWGVRDVFARLGQESMQRAFATRGEADARKAFITYALVSLPGQLVFFSIGTLLFVYYGQHPELLPQNLNDNAIFPLYIVQRMPAGITGLVFAGIFAASMSTLDSAMNSVATILTRDVYAVCRRTSEEREKLYVARWITVLAGAIGTGFALYLSTFEVGSLWDLFEKIVGYLSGGAVGVMTLGLMTRRANARGVLVGVAVATVLPPVLDHWTELHPFTFGGLSMLACVGIGYAVSLLPGGRVPRLDGLTVWTPVTTELAADR